MAQRIGAKAAEWGPTMSVVETSIEIAAAPERVWGVVADPRNLPRWDSRIAGVEGVPDRGLGEGTEYRVKLRFMGAHASVPARVAEFRAPEYARVHLSGLVDATVETWVDAAGDGRSRLRHRVDYRFPGGPLGSLAARAIKLIGAQALLRRGTQAQKRQVEGE